MSLFEAERAPLEFGDHLAPGCRHVLVPRHESLSVLMPPHENFFVLCLDAARAQSTSWTRASLRIIATAEEHVQQPRLSARLQYRSVWWRIAVVLLENMQREVDIHFTMS